MKALKLLIMVIFGCLWPAMGQTEPNGDEILIKVDRSMASKTKVIVAKMIVHGRRASRSFRMKAWIEGDEKAFVEFLDPPRERGTKMLKIGKKLWMYSPSADRTILIAGHMLRQSMMGSDLSYEDIMEDKKLHDLYQAKVIGEEKYLDRPCWVMQLTPKVKDVTYYSRKMWVDKDRHIILKEEMYGKSGRLLKEAYVEDVKVMGGRWVATRSLFKDALKSGKGTEFIIEDIKFDVKIPPYIFSKAALRR